MTKKRVAGRFVREDGEAVPEVAKRAIRAPRPMYCRTYTRKRVAEALPGIVRKFTEEAMKGSVPHAKALMTISGLDKGDIIPKSTKRRGKSLAQMLMGELEGKPKKPGDGPQ